MSERDSNPSFGETGTTAPVTHETSDNSNETTHGYFIPVVILIVLGVTIVSTFYSKEFNSLFTGAGPTAQVDEPASEVRQNSLAIKQVSDNPEDRTESNTNTENTPVTEASHETATGVVETAVAGPGFTTADTPSPEATVEQALTGEFKGLVPMKDKVSYSDKKYLDSYPHAPPGTYVVPQQHHESYNEMMEQRRRLYEEAVQERREHRIKMREYRARVLKRIEQDRLDMHKRMQEIEQEHQRRLDKQMSRMELVAKRSINHPI